MVLFLWKGRKAHEFWCSLHHHVGALCYIQDRLINSQCVRLRFLKFYFLIDWIFSLDLDLLFLWLLNRLHIFDFLFAFWFDFLVKNFHLIRSIFWFWLHIFIFDVNRLFVIENDFIFFIFLILFGLSFILFNNFNGIFQLLVVEVLLDVIDEHDSG